MIKTVIGSFDSFDEARQVVRDLKDEGFMESDISIVASNRTGGDATSDRTPNDLNLDPAVTGDTARETSTTRSMRGTTTDADDVDDTTTGNATGAATGAVTGGVLGGAAGVAVSLMGLAIPGIGPIIAAGPIVAGLTGAGVGAVAGGLIGGLTSLGVSEEHAEYYAESVRRGGALVTIRCDESRAERAAQIMQDHGAVDIERRVERWRDTGWTGYDRNAQASTGEMETGGGTYGDSSVGGLGRSAGTTSAVDPERMTGGRTSGIDSSTTTAGTMGAASSAGRGLGATDVSGTGSRGAGGMGTSGSSGLGTSGSSSGLGSSSSSGMGATTSGSTLGGSPSALTGGAPRTRAQSDWNSVQDDFRREHDRTYAGQNMTFDDYAPAYRHGYESAQSDTYRGRNWNDVEPNLRSDWERSNPGGTWERMKDAVRRGWDRLTGDTDMGSSSRDTTLGSSTTRTRT